MNENNDGGVSTERGFGEVQEREIPSEDANSEDTQDERVEDDQDESSDDNSDQADDQQGDEGKEDDDDENSQQPKLTEKGTKLDPNPKSAVHQQLANERRIRSQMEQVLASPELLAKFVREQYGIEMPISRGAAPTGQQPASQQTQATTPKKWTAKDFESLEDVADKFNQLQESFTSEITKRDDEIKVLKDQLGGLSERGRILRIADNLEGDVKALSSNPELNPNSPEFIPGLEDEIGAFYHKLDFDEASGMYRGNYSLREIGESMIKTARAAKKAGSQRAQTIVKDKTGGKIRTGQGSQDVPSRDELTPAQSIAQGIAKMFK